MATDRAGSNDTRSAMGTTRAQSLVSKQYSPLYRTRAPWRNSSFQVSGREEQDLELVNVIFPGKWVFAEVIKDLETKRSFWINYPGRT
jgi:hypothetical protein